jgi:adenine-specific DNA-methyltransferase
MPTTEQLRAKLLDKLKDLFQLNQPDLDFGFYRIMHAKSEQVINFIEYDLLRVIQDTFGQVDETNKAKLKQELDNAIQTAKEYGSTEPENSPKVKEAKAKYEAIRDGATSEGEIYDHLYRFFERYYDDGDFITRRYYTRETPGKAAPFAVPYNGEEVKLHWANADQYYIKTTEYFTNFTVNLTEAIRNLRENQKSKSAQLDLLDSSVPEGLKLHFKIVDATEGEHSNVKASDATKRYFILHKDNPLELDDNNELIINFEYRPDQAGAKQDALNKDTIASIINALKLKPDMAAYYECLSIAIPTDKDKDRILLCKYINQYTARNTMDYFIHKNLGAFLKRELDFYIKNEVMHLDDIENAEASKVEDYLTKLRVLRQIATKLIDFMAQLEDFQKKLWLKKKFIVETNYCITLDRIPEELYPQIIANEAQRQEWIKLFAIDEIEGDTVSPAYSEPLTINFLKANDKLVLDTRFFDETFKNKLLSSIEDFDEQCDGLLIHSENFQALNLLLDRYREQVKCVYIDPPYNTNASEILYKNGFKHSSWLSMIQNRIDITVSILSNNGLLEVAIDNVEFHKLEGLLEQTCGEDNHVTTIAIMNNPKGRDQEHIAESHDYTLLYAKDIKQLYTGRLLLSEDQMKKKYSKSHEHGSFRELPLRRSGSDSSREDRPYMYFPFIFNPISGDLSVVQKEEYQLIFNGNSFNDDYVFSLRKFYEDNGLKFILPIRSDGRLGRWRWGYEACLDGCKERVLIAKGQDNITVYQIDHAEDSYLPKSFWYGERHDSSTKGTNILKDIVGINPFDYPKSLYSVEDFITIGGENDILVMDYFAGSGTTAHAVIDLNRSDLGSRRFVLVEMGDHFDTVLKPRISKVVYSKDWKDGKPQNRDTGVSHCYKYLRLESYEDTLNNLVLTSEPEREKALAVSPALQEDYLLHYMLEVESRGSLLNIDAFSDPTAYLLKVKKPGSDEYVEKAVDLIETFNYLIGLRLVHLAEPQTFTASFTRLKDPDLPQDQETKLVIDGDLKQAADGKWWIRKVEGWVPRNPYSPNDGLKEKVLIVWRKLTGDLEEDNLVLDTWFQKNRINTLDWEFNTIYVNGSNNLPNLQLEGESWKVRLIEEEFLKRMWSAEGV